MVLNAKDIPITRADVHLWYDEWRKSGSKQPIEEMLEDRIANLNLDDRMVNTTSHDDYGDETDIVQMILDDLDSYGH